MICLQTCWKIPAGSPDATLLHMVASSVGGNQRHLSQAQPGAIQLSSDKVPPAEFCYGLSSEGSRLSPEGCYASGSKYLHTAGFLTLTLHAALPQENSPVAPNSVCPSVQGRYRPGKLVRRYKMPQGLSQDG